MEERRAALRRAVARHRVLLAAGLAAGAVAAGVQAASAEPAGGLTVLTAATDLPAGQALGPEDLAAVELPAAAVPAGAVDAAAAVGRVLAAPVRQGEPVTDVRLVGPGLVDGLPTGLVAAPARIAEAEVAAMLQPGQTVDVLAARAVGDGLARAEPVAPAVRVLTVPAVDDEAGGSAEGALVLLATTPATAERLAAAAVDSRLTVVLRGPAG